MQINKISSLQRLNLVVIIEVHFIIIIVKLTSIEGERVKKKLIANICSTGTILCILANTQFIKNGKQRTEKNNLKHRTFSICWLWMSISVEIIIRTDLNIEVTTCFQDNVKTFDLPTTNFILTLFMLPNLLKPFWYLTGIFLLEYKRLKFLTDVSSKFFFIGIIETLVSN
ncbi:hypothetical protein BpHYR1_020751 [Brachionus plicatilis]|uniref:Uncharacterized protein n=1 Tax=Brachionus plicatilis TaxID=10195 RepID=A0A3M7RFI6_BRAPC|nr:hypothetical protein BpHYR1_020751 [Brachionus plicatilis]